MVVDFVSVFISFCSLAVAVIIGFLQLRQGKMLDDFTHRQDVRDEIRYFQSVKSEANAFVIKYHDYIGYLPMCLMAFMYDNKRPYYRDMFTEFNLLSTDVQDEILKSQNMLLPRYSGDDFWRDCYDALCTKLSKDYIADYSYNHAFIYDAGKYLYRSIARYGKEALLHVNSFDVSKHITDLLCDHLDGNVDNPIALITNDYQLSDISEKECCEILTYTMEYVAIYDDSKIDYEYWIPPYGRETIETMEDLFLVMLVAVYAKLYLPYHKS